MNKAKRLLNILDSLLAVPVSKGTSSEQAWAAALGLDQGGGDAEDEAAMALQAFRAELGLVIARLDESGVQNDLYLSQFTRLRNAASTTTLRASWDGIIGNLTPPDVRLALAWAAHTLPESEGELDEADLASLKEGFDKLQAGIDAADLPPVMRSFVQKQLGVLRAALRMYRVRGVVAVEEAIHQTFGAMQVAKKAMETEASMASPKARTTLQWFNDQVGRVIHVLDSTNKAHKGGSSMIDMADGMTKAIEWIKNLPGN